MRPQENRPARRDPEGTRGLRDVGRGFSRPTFPAMSAGAAKRMTCHSGKFHGITASTGPNGWYVT